jgi:outer membrane protein
MTAAPRLSGLLLGLLAFGAQAMSLSEALQLAAENDPAVAVSLAQYAADREASAEDRGSLLPLVSANGDWTYARTESTGVFGQSSDRYPGWGAQLVLRQPLFRLDWSARGERAEALDARADIALQDRRLQLMARVADRYFQVLVAQDALAAAESEQAAVERSLEDTRQRFAVDLVPGTDLREAEARRDLAEARQLAARTQLEIARDALDEITGRGDAALPALAEDAVFPPLSPAAVDDWLAAAEVNNPRLQAAEQSARIAKADVLSTRAAGLPTVDAVASAGRQDTSEFNFGQKVDDARIGVEVTIPLYSGGRATAALRAADAGAEAARADVVRLRSETRRETRSLHRQVQTAYIEARALDRALRSAITAEAATRAGYDAGTHTTTDVLDAQSRVVNARRDLKLTQYTLLLRVLQLKQLAGTLSPADFTAIDHWLSAASDAAATPATPES